MTDPLPALAPAPALFDVTALTDTGVNGTLARLPLDQLELAENPRKAISPEGIERLAAMLMRLGQLSPCLGWRPAGDRPVRLYDGQRRLLAAQASERLAGSAGFEGLALRRLEALGVRDPMDDTDMHGDSFLRVPFWPIVRGPTA